MNIALIGAGNLATNLAHALTRAGHKILAVYSRTMQSAQVLSERLEQAFPDAEVFCFYMDLRLFGRHYEDIYLKAQKEYGVRFIRGRVAEVSENYDGTLLVKAEDTVAGKPLKVTLDLLVLMAGMRPSASGKAIGDLLEMSVEEDGYFAVRSGIAAGQRSPIPGIFLAGAATGPKTLPETLQIHRNLQRNQS